MVNAARRYSPPWSVEPPGPGGATPIGYRPLDDRFLAYWSVLREMVIEDSVLVLVQRMSRR
jgi:hypothetical protein